MVNVIAPHLPGMQFADKNHKTEGLGDSSVGKGLPCKCCHLSLNPQNRTQIKQGLVSCMKRQGNPQKSVHQLGIPNGKQQKIDPNIG